MSKNSNKQPPAKSCACRIRSAANHEREGINPSPTKRTIGAGFTPARAKKKTVGAGFIPSRAKKKTVGAGFIPSRAKKKTVGAGFIAARAKKKIVGAGFIPARAFSCFPHGNTSVATTDTCSQPVIAAVAKSNSGAG